MQKYPVKASHRALLTVARLEELSRGAFENVVVEGSAVVASFGAIRQIRSRTEGKELVVDVTTDPKVDVGVAAETVRRYNRFLEEATGYTAKERAKRLRKSAGPPDAGA